MNELIKTHHAVIGGETVNAVNARELHKQLKTKTQFNHWIKRRIEEYAFAEDVDFTVVKNDQGDTGRFAPIDYIITIDMAKELCMVENNPQGRKIRQYFIEIEKQYRNGAIASTESIVTAITPVIRENERLRARLDLARNFFPEGNPGDLNKDGNPKNQFRRGYYTSGKGRSIMALIERMEQPGLFDEIELRQISC